MQTIIRNTVKKLSITLALTIVAAPTVASDSEAIAYRRLTESQYRHAVADIFNPEIEINARFEPELREAGLQAIGNARLSITTSGLEQYLSLARSISRQIIESENSEALIGCSLSDKDVRKSKSAKKASSQCAQEFIESRGSQLVRRPLADDEISAFMNAYKDGVAGTGLPKKGLSLALIGMLMSPEFLFRVERAEPDPQNSEKYRLDAYTKAARVSYLLWDAAPDAELLKTAKNGSIHKTSVLDKQVKRLLASSRLEDGIRAFFTDMFQFEMFESLTKDGATYPKFSQAVADSAREETLKFMVHQLMTKDGDYRDIFTAKETFINRSLAAVYDVPYLSKADWTQHEFSEESERSGVLTQTTFLSLFSHPAASSPTKRGVKIYDIFQCIALPDPPPDVDFSTVQAVENGTVRTRLIEHKTNPGCYSCHNISDPPGLALEHFDSLGQHRILENGDIIDVSAEINGKAFDGSIGLGEFMHDNPLATQCLVRKVHNYGIGRGDTSKDREILKRQNAFFAENGYKLPSLLRSVLMDPDFFQIEKPAIETADENTSKADLRVSSNTGVAQ